MGLVERKIDEIFIDTVRQFGQSAAVVYQNETYTWHELDILSDIIADRLKKQGVTRGDRVGLWSENSAAWIITFLALQKLGAVAALLNVSYKRRELERALRIGEIQWLCYGNAPALSENSDLIEITAKKIGKNFRGVMDIREESLDLPKILLENPDFSAPVYENANCRDLACILYTTGTTREPKCVLHSHHSLVNNAIVTANRIRMNADDCICVSQPLFHVFGLISSLLTSIYSGSMLCVLSRFGSEDILQCVQRHCCTILNGVPTNFICMISNPVFNRYRTDSLRLSIIGGASISATQIDYIRHAFPTVKIMRNYGLTEGCNLCNSEYSDNDGSVSRSVGRPYPHIELAIHDSQRQCFLPAGEKGEIVVRGYSVMQGYYNSPTCSQPDQAVDADGWLHTGDLGVIDSNGYLSIAGRLKDIIIRGGENISPVEVCSEIMRYEPILDALVIGAPHPVLGEEVIACLVLDEPWDYSEQELRSMLKVRLARFKIPAFFLIYQQFPLNANGKVDMRRLREDVYGKVKELHKNDERYNMMLQQTL